LAGIGADRNCGVRDIGEYRDELGAGHRESGAQQRIGLAQFGGGTGILQ
jgi:hypothetical protein